MFANRLWARVFSVLLVLSGLAEAQLLNQAPLPRPGQNQNPGAASAQESTPTFHTSSHLVIVNVVVTDRDGKPITGLKKDDFTVLEDGKAEPLRVFEPHVPAKQLAAIPDLHLGASEFTNFPKQAANTAVNVVLFDILNTPTDDQMFARQQMIDFLKTLPRGQRVALFTLGYDLKMVAGFTTSTDELIAAAKKIRPGVSALLDTEKDMAMEDHVQGNLASGGSPSQNSNNRGPASTGGPNIGGGPISSGVTGVEPQDPASGGDARSMAQMMQEFTAESRLVRTDMRMEKTFESLGALARALSGYTGRKNLLWLSEGFPAAVLPRREYSHPDARNYLAIFQKYSGLLEASQISVYPIDIRGVMAYERADGNPEYTAPARQNSDLSGAQMLMRDVAEQTGGQAFANTNDLKGALQHSIEHGSTYYTLAYSPTNRDWNGGFRRIAVKMNRPETKLAYRQGYYAVKDDPSPADTARRMMISEMQPGIPESTMLLLRVKVTSADNGTGKVSIDYGVYASDLTFTGDEQKQAKLEFVAVAWDKDNHPAGNVSATMNLDLKPETFKRMMQTGVPAHQELTLKPGTYKLRLGVMDYASSKIGTLEVPVTVASAQRASK